MESFTEEAEPVRPACCLYTKLCFHRYPSKCSPDSRHLYLFLTIITTTLMASLLIPNVQLALRSTFRDFNATCTDMKFPEDSQCSQLTAYMAIYKMSFPVVGFFLIMAIITYLKASSNKGFWCFKLSLIILTVSASFVIPISHFSTLHKIWMIVTLLGNGLYMIAILLCLIDSTNKFSRIMFNKFHTDPLFVVYCELGINIVILILWLGLLGLLLWSLRAKELCILSLILLCINSGFCGLMVMVSATPCARVPAPTSSVAMPDKFLYSSCWGRGRIIQSGLVSLYILFWTASSMSSSPSQSYDDLLQSLPAYFGFLSTSLLFMLLCSFYIVYSLESSKSSLMLRGFSQPDCSNIQKLPKFPFYHILWALALFFATTQLTGWYTGFQIRFFQDISRNWVTVGAKAISTWLCLIIYILYLLLPCKIPKLELQEENRTTSRRNWYASPLPKRRLTRTEDIVFSNNFSQANDSIVVTTTYI